MVASYLKPFACLMVVAALSILAAHEVTFWQDTETLFGRTLRLDPSNSLARNLLYIEARRAGDLKKAQSYSSPTVYGDARKTHGFFGAYFPADRVAGAEH